MHAVTACITSSRKYSSQLKPNLPLLEVLQGSHLVLPFFLELHPPPPFEQQSPFSCLNTFILFLHSPVFWLYLWKQNPCPAGRFASAIKGSET